MNYFNKFKKYFIEAITNPPLRALVFLGLANLIPDTFLLRHLKVIILKTSGVKVGLNSLYFISPINIDRPKNITIGKNVFFNRNTYFEGKGKIMIGDQCQIGPNTVFATTKHDIFNAMEDSFDNITINNNVWIGANVVVLKGVKIGPNVSIAAGSVVNKNFDNCIIAGNPARKIMDYK